MGTQKTQVSVNTAKLILDKSFEQTVDCDLTLPDYCFEIVRILKCVGTPNLLQVQKNDTKIVVDGYVRFVVMYTSKESDVLRCYTHNENFTKTIDTKTALQDDLIDISLKSEFVNCRATGSRALSIRSSVSVHVNQTQIAPGLVTTDLAGSDIQLKKNTVSLSAPSVFSQKMFAIESSFTPEEDRVNCVLHTEANISVNEFKIITGKVVVKGESALSCTYLCDDGTATTIQQKTGFSQILNVDGAAPEMMCKLKAKVGECKGEITQDIDGSGTVINFLVLGELTALCSEEKQVEIVLDGYSTLYESDDKLSTFTAQKYEDLPAYSQKVIRKIKCETPIKEFLATWYDLQVLSSKILASKASVACNVRISAVCAGEDEAIHFIEKNVDFLCDIDNLPFVEGKFENLEMTLQNPSLHFDSGNLDFSCDALMGGFASQQFSFTVLSDLQQDTAKPKVRDKSIALTIYYAQSGEDVWDIAKRYNTSVGQVMGANSLTEMTLAAPMAMLIPMVTE